MIKILSVDDEQDLELLLTQYFRRKIRNGEYQFYFAHNGIEALAVLASTPDIDIVLSDINMPEMDGLSLLQKLNERHDPSLKVIMVSAYGEMSNIRQAMNGGAFDFAMKPIDLEDLERTIAKAVAEIDFVKQTQAEHGQLVDIKTDLAMAAEIQKAILPRESPIVSAMSDIDLQAYMKPAKDVGGDFYDYFRIDDEHIGFCMADVSGKGVPAAIFMAVSHTLLRMAGRRTLNASDAITESNDILSDESPNSMFVTMFYGVLHIPTGTITYVNAGHNPPYVLHADGKVEMLPVSENICLGVMGGFRYKSNTIQLQVGDTLVTFTDGVTEACSVSNELYGEARLESLLSTLNGASGRDIVNSIADAVHQHAAGAEQSDDITIMCISKR